MKIFGNWKLLLKIVTLVSLCFALAAAAIAIGTDHWIVIENPAFEVKKPHPRHELFPRHYGIIRQCFDVNIQPADLKEKEKDKWGNQTQGLCHFVDYQVPRTPGLLLDADASSYIHLLRSIFVMAVFAVASLFIALAAFLLGISKFGKTSLRVSILCSALGCISLLVLLILFHFRLRMEWQTLTTIKFGNDTKRLYRLFYMGMSPSDRERLDYFFSWSYMVTWFGVAFALASAAITKQVLNTLATLRDDEKYFAAQALDFKQSEADFPHNFAPPNQTAPAVPPNPLPDAEDIDYMDPRFAISRPKLNLQYF